MDQSISRSHAKLTVSSPAIAAGATPTAAPPTVTLKDLSKFGTRVNGCKVERNGSGLAVVELKNGEELKFGGTPTSTVFRHVCTPLHHTPQRLLHIAQGVFTLAFNPDWSVCTEYALISILNECTLSQTISSIMDGLSWPGGSGMWRILPEAQTFVVFNCLNSHQSYVVSP